ncbi:MAG: PilZ domain-containing protein [Acidobacteria bacterium]|nr:PilZ domain-containing protein [Acidobacteriota bacterium]
MASRSEYELVSAPPRCSPRIEPPCPITVAIEEEGGGVVAYGVVADISKWGGCIRTDVLLAQDARFRFRISVASPPEVHTAVGTVAWARADPDCSQASAYSCGVEWISLGYTLRCRLRQLAHGAVPSGKRDRFVFESKWVVNGPWPNPTFVIPSPPATRWDPSGPQTGPLTLPSRLRAAVRSKKDVGLERAAVIRLPRQRVRGGDQ